MSSLDIETWIWYGCVVLLVSARILSRSLLLGSIKHLQIDDYMMLFALCTYTAECVTMLIVAKSQSNLIAPGDELYLTPQNVKERIYGSKITLVVEQCAIATIWTIKACLLVMYGRLTMSLKQHWAVKIVAGYTAFGFVFMEIFYYGVWCRPFQNYWAVPTPNSQCSAATKHLITNAVFNISSDLLIIAIPMPIFLKAQLQLRKKLILCGVFGLGAFTILSAILNKYYSFTQPFGLQWTFWYIREASTAMLTANIPFTWTLLQRAFKLRSFVYSSDRPRYTTNAYGHHTRTTYNNLTSTGAGTKASGRGRGDTPAGVGDLERDASTERIHQPTKDGSIPLEIWQNVQFTVHTTKVGEDGKSEDVEAKEVFPGGASRSSSDLGSGGNISTTIGRGI